MADWPCGNMKLAYNKMSTKSGLEFLGLKPSPEKTNMHSEVLTGLNGKLPNIFTGEVHPGHEKLDVMSPQRCEEQRFQQFHNGQFQAGLNSKVRLPSLETGVNILPPQTMQCCKGSPSKLP